MKDLNLEEMSKGELIRELGKLRAAERRFESTVDQTDPRRSIHELHVHQVELEMQNRELREAQQLLEESRGRYADLYDFAPVGYCTLDRGGHIREMNLTGAALLGSPKEQLLGRPFASVVPLRDKASFHKHLTRCSQEEGRVTTELLMLLKERSPVVVQMVSVPARDAHGAVTEYRTMLVDISALKALEDKLRFLAEAGETLACSLDYRGTAFAAVHIAVPFLADACFIDVLDEDGQLQRLHAVFADTKKQTDLGERVKGFALQPGWDTPQSRVIASGESVVLPALPDALPRSARTDDKEASVMQAVGVKSMMIVPLTARGRALGALTFVAAESDRRYSSADLVFAEDIGRRAGMAMDNARLHEQAQRAIGSRDRLLAAVSHDLGNPLGIILLRTSVMLQIPADKDRRVKSRKGIESIHRSAQRMNRLIGDLLLLASVESGTLSIEKDRQPIAALVGEALEMLQWTAAQRSQRLERDFPKGDSFDVLCDRDRILQVFANLIGNAIKFGREGGSVTVRAEPCEGEVRFSVVDTGPGIPLEDLPHLFDRFWQAKKTARLGTGLGLSIAKGVVEVHGGRIWVESQVGVGSAFFFTLPFAPGVTPQPVAFEPREAAAPSPRRVVLVIEDDAEAREALTAVLEREEAAPGRTDTCGESAAPERRRGTG